MEVLVPFHICSCQFGIAAAATFSCRVSLTTPDVLKIPSIVNYVKLPYWKNKDFIMVIYALALTFSFLSLF